MIYTIGEMAKLLKVPPSTLRFYDKMGLIPFVERSESGVRVFSEKDYEGLKIIECLKKTGMSIKDIKKFVDMVMLGDETIDERLELMKAQQKNVKRKIEEFNEMLEILDYKCWFYETAKRSGSTDVPREMTDDEVPEKFAEIRKRLKNKTDTSL